DGLFRRWRRQRWARGWQKRRNWRLSRGAAREAVRNRGDDFLQLGFGPGNAFARPTIPPVFSGGLRDAADKRVVLNRQVVMQMIQTSPGRGLGFGIFFFPAILAVAFAANQAIGGQNPSLIPTNIVLTGPEARQRLLVEKTKDNEFVGQLTNQ